MLWWRNRDDGTAEAASSLAVAFWQLARRYVTAAGGDVGRVDDLLAEYGDCTVTPAMTSEIIERLDGIAGKDSRSEVLGG